MKKLLLFDIDGTLTTGGPAEDPYTGAIKRAHNITIVSDADFRGYTDYLILVALLKGENWSDDRIAAAMPQLLVVLDAVHHEGFQEGVVRLLPGVKPLLAALQGKAVLGLLTGNLQTIARRKLTPLGVWDYFTVGGFGSDPHTTRAQLVTTAIKRAGYEGYPELVYVIGDTPKDIAAAQAAGVKAVGVANGFRDVKELKDAGATIALKDFKDAPGVLKELGIG